MAVKAKEKKKRLARIATFCSIWILVGGYFSKNTEHKGILRSDEKSKYLLWQNERKVANTRKSSQTQSYLSGVGMFCT